MLRLGFHYWKQIFIWYLQSVETILGVEISSRFKNQVSILLQFGADLARRIIRTGENFIIGKLMWGVLVFGLSVNSTSVISDEVKKRQPEVKKKTIRKLRFREVYFVFHRFKCSVA